MALPSLGTWGRYSRPVAVGLLCYTSTSLLVLLGLTVGSRLSHQGWATKTEGVGALSPYFQTDGLAYRSIAVDGYRYDPERPSSVAFFPGYPLLARVVSWATGLCLEVSLVATAHVFLAGSFIVLAVYLSYRREDLPRKQALATLLAFGLFPVTFFFRMALSESTFMFFALLACIGMQRRWPLALVALVVGATTAIRPVGVCLIPAFFLHLGCDGRSWRTNLCRGLICAPLVGWGLEAYMIYQHMEFGDALAYSKTQENYRFREFRSRGERILALATLEPILSVYDRRSPAYWGWTQPGTPAWVNLAFANPLYFIMAITLVAVGWRREWLTRQEVIIGFLLVLVPYFARGYEMCMASQARYASAAFPIYLVLGQLVSHVPRLVTMVLSGLAGFFLVAYAALFAAGFPML